MNAAQQKQQFELGFGTMEGHRDRSSEAFIAERLTDWTDPAHGIHL